jgi:uncharacterized protein
MNPEYFIIKTDFSEVNFIANKETGKWVLANTFDEKVRQKISCAFVKRQFQGFGKIVLNMGRECNFDCIYCLVGDLKNQKFKLTEKVGKKVVEIVSQLDPDERHIVFHGSEPMFSYDLIKELIQYNKEQCGDKVSFSIQSNGSLFNEANLEFLVDNNVGIGISLDGLENHQNYARPYRNSSHSYLDVKKNLLKVKKIQGDISTITVVTKHNVSDLVKIVESYEHLGLKSVLFVPVSPKRDTSLVPDLNELTRNMQNVLERFVEKEINKEKTVKIRNLRDYLRNFFRPKTTSNCLQCGSGYKQPIIAIDYDGSIYPCDYFWGKELYRIGNIFDMPLKSATNSNKNFRVYRDVDNIRECSRCIWKRFCGGGCPGGTEAFKYTIESKSIYCKYNKNMLKYIAKKIPEIHSKGLIRHFIS